MSRADFSGRCFLTRLSGLLLLVWCGVPARPAQNSPAIPDVVLRSGTNQVGKYQKIEFSLAISGQYTNPFDPDEVQVDLRLQTPSRHQLTIPAFYGQNYERRDLGPGVQHREWLYPSGVPSWKARFSPTELGTYEAVATVKNSSGVCTSAVVTFKCLSSDSRGFLRVSHTDLRFLEFSEGQPFFALGQNLAFIGSQQYVTLTRAEDIFRRLAENGANYLRIWTCCEDWAMAVEARKSAWGRSWDWRPPIVSAPGDESTGRKCLKIPAKGIKLEPSHPLALRPDTRYRLSGRVFTESQAVLRVESVLLKPNAPPGISAHGTWKEFEYELRTGIGDFWLPIVNFQVEGDGSAWVGDVSLKEAGGGPELLWEAEVDRPPRGFYNPVDCFLLDELVIRAQENGLYLQLCLLTRDLYMEAMKDPASPAYEHAIRDAQKLFRYAIARWGYSTSIAAWEYWNEMNPALPTDQFYSAMGEYLAQADVYHHLRTTSTWGPSAKDCRHPQLDMADVHFYLRPSDKGRLEDEVEAVVERTRWLREQAPHKPAHLGEFGLANEKWGLTEEMQQSRALVDVHNELWASALSGASGTALSWWWERLDQRDVYSQYRPLSKFLTDVPWTSGNLQPLKLETGNPDVRGMGLRADTKGWLWIFHREGSWAKMVIAKHPPDTVSKAHTTVKDMPNGIYAVRWWHTVDGTITREERVPAANGSLQLSPPDFAQDIACDFKPTD